MELRIDPWSGQQYADYGRLRDQFGIEAFDPAGLPNPSRLIRRGVIFGQRGFDSIKRAIDGHRPFTILTGLMPSGNMHIGHKMVIDQVMYFQSLGAQVYIAVADIEAFASRGKTFEQTATLAIDEYVKNYIALGLKPGQVYFQSKRAAVKDMGYTLAKRVNLSKMKALYGFEDSTNMAHMFAPLVQMGDILHVQLDKYSGLAPVLVPVGIDQDPHMRLTRDVAGASRIYSLLPDDGKFGADAGLFVKVADDVEGHLDRAKALLTKLGYGKLKPNYAYKAIYIDGIAKADLPVLDEALLALERERNPNAFFSPASTYHRFITGLTGGKMSSSQPESSIFLSDAPEEAKKKVMSCKTGGRVSLQEQKEKGGVPEDCVVYELFLYHLEDSDAALEEIHRTCKSGERMCGTCKKQAAELMVQFLATHQEKVKAVGKAELDAFVRED